LKNNGIDLFLDTEFVLLTQAYGDTIMAVNTGLVHAGFLRSGSLETYSAVNASTFRVLNAENTTYLNPVTRLQTAYQWPTSVTPQPTSVLMVNQNTVDPFQRSAIADALMDITSSSRAATLGNYTGWFPPQNYLPLYQSQIQLGVIQEFSQPGQTRCIMNSNVYDFVACPAGTVKRHITCSIEVPPTYTCLTNPCVKLPRVALVAIWLPIVLGVCGLLLSCLFFAIWLYCQRYLVQQCDLKQLHIHSEIVGESTLGSVYKGTYYEIPVVVKIVKHKNDDIQIRHINKKMREANILRHRNIVPLIGTVRYDKKILVLMPYRCSSLYELLYNRLVPISVYQQVGIMLDVVYALKFLHSNEVFGRRLISAHLMVDDSWNVQLGTNFSENDLAWVCAPELRTNNCPDEASDVYHLAMLLYEILHRTMPTRRLHTHEGAHTPDLRGQSDPLHNLIRSCWSVDPKQRPSLYSIEQLLKSCQYGSLADEYVQDRDKNKDLLKQRLPHTVSHRIQHDHLVPPTTHDNVSMMSIGFGSLAIDCSSTDMMHLHLTVKHVVEDVAAKTNTVLINTIDYSLMLVAGLHMPQQDHVERIIQTAVDVQKAVKNLVVKIGKHDIVPAVRIGIHAGKVTARVLGRSPPVYCLMGRDVVTTCCLQETCEVNRMQLSYATVCRVNNVPDDVHLQMHHIADYSPHKPLLPTVLLSSRSNNFSKSVPSSIRL
jgi:hypothetical protein